jgi:hypothetical protein
VVVKRDLDISKTRLLDVFVGALLLYVAVWIYELGNLAVLSSVGSQASLVFSGFLPIGVSASVSDTNLLLLAKPAQIALSSLAMLGLFFLVRSMKLRISSNVAITATSIYLASAYWELLSSVGAISYEVHLAIFTILAIGAQIGLSNVFRASVPRESVF